MKKRTLLSWLGFFPGEGRTTVSKSRIVNKLTRTRETQKHKVVFNTAFDIHAVCRLHLWWLTIRLGEHE